MSTDEKGPSFSDTTVLQRARADLAAIVESSEDAIVSKTLEGIVTSWNAAAERLFGYTAQEMIGRSILQVIPPHLHPDEARILSELRAGRRIDRYETIRVHKSGRTLEVSLTISPVKDASGQVVGAAKIAHDISERRQVEQALKDEAVAMETLNRVGRAIAALTELDKIVQQVTDAATELTGASFGAFFYSDPRKDSLRLYTLSGTSREAFERFPMPRNTAVFAPTLIGNTVVRSSDILQDPRYGHSAPYHGLPPGHLPLRSYLAVPVSLTPSDIIGGLFFGHPEPGVFTERDERLAVGIAGQASIAMVNARLFQSLRDKEASLEDAGVERERLLDSERAARAEAERLGHLKDEFLATLSHELRTPLNAILGWATILKRKDALPADRERGLDAIERNARAQAQIVNDLLDMSRIISGKIHLEVQPIYLHEVIEHALESIQQSAAAKNLRVQKMLDSGIGRVRGDANRLQQMLWNLLTNAVKFTPAGGRIQVILERVNSHAEIVVEDSGIGIAPDFLPYAFDRFRQGDASTTRRHGGLGLGLSIVKNLVELHGGSVRVKSPGINQGSTFILELPISHVRSEDERTRRTATVADDDPLAAGTLPRLDGVRVLIVDDEPDGRALLARILQAQGTVPTSAASVDEALELMQRNSFDIVLSDIGMPQMDGYEFIRRVRTLDTRRAKPLPAIAITAYARPEDRQRSLLAGYHMHLSKPIETAELIAGMASLLQLAG